MSETISNLDSDFRAILFGQSGFVDLHRRCKPFNYFRIAAAVKFALANNNGRFMVL